MDRSWMQLQNRLCNEYVEGVRTFIQAAKQHLRVDNKTRCPCRQCLNVRFQDLIIVEQHLIRYGFSSSYNRWIHHGDEVEGVSHVQPDMCSDSNGCTINDNYVDDEINDAINDMHGPRNKEVNSNESIGHEIGRNGKNIDYLFSEAHRELSSNKSFNMLLKLLLDAFPNGANIPKSHYDAKKMLRDFGLGYVSIHACKYDCALFWKENETFHNCPCNEPRYKNGKIPQKVLRHFPLKPRLQRLFMSRYTSADMRWHKEKRFHEDGVLRHPADSEVWKDFDNQYPWFAQDARNVRLGLATDGFNPFGTMSNNYSMWPVVLVPYNMPPWKCMKESFFMMSLLIPGPHAPDDLKELWHDGVHTFDMSSGDYFRMYACLLWTIHDFPLMETCAVGAQKGIRHGIRSKICYMGHRRFLPLNHSWRRSRQHDGKLEHRPPPKTLSGEDILQQLSHVYNSRPARLDLADMKIRNELHLQLKGNKLLKPHACYTLTFEERKEFCKFLKSVKFPDGYAANISRNVNISDGKILGLKSHDCHVLLQQLLPVGIRPYLNKDICVALVELSGFFQKLCPKTLYVANLERLEEGIRCIYLVRLSLLDQNLGTLKKYVTNKARPEGSIAEAYTVNEALTFCSMYLHGIETCFTRDERNEDNLEEQATRPIGGRQLQQLSKEELEKAHWYVINNSTQTHQVFYLDDYKNGQNWKVVQKVQHRHLWDILEVDSNIEVDANFDETNKDDAYQENESCDIEWSFELDDQLERFDHINVNLEVINNNILCMGDRDDDGDDDFICDDIIEEEDIIVDNDNIVEEWLSSESESD
ncbi:hypothetical protein AAG906_039008 [Vitis piasezkii]